MLKINRKSANPINIIAVFAFISETSAAVSLPFLDNDEREIYIWFLICFPFYLLFLFFITLNFNYRSLYAPFDFNSDKNFLKAFEETSPPSPKESSNPETLKIPILKFPKPLSTLCIIDVREANIDLTAHLLLKQIQKSARHLPGIILVLTHGKPEPSPEEAILKSLKQDKKPVGTTYWIIYDAHSLRITASGKI
ncbi:hypothetical protein [Pseudomonas sp. KCJK9016]|uniref:hypothetical protein n=1 Tax=Pseudomonas sp. KCJK9016 TaxID=3344556 RepID=UPI003906918B